MQDKSCLFAMIITLFFGLSIDSFGQIDATMMRFPDVSESHIVFTYADNIWTVPKSGGQATLLTTAKGTESFAKFSPDGQTIAYNANYHGTRGIYTIPLQGGAPNSITHSGTNDLMLDWYPDGKSILFRKSQESGKQRFSQFYKVSKEGGLPEKLPVAYGEFATVSTDMNRIAFTPKSRVFRTWKRYRGGSNTDIYLFDLKSYKSENITNHDGSDELPMWYNNRVVLLIRSRTRPADESIRLRSWYQEN